jgi:hypothetical protein
VSKDERINFRLGPDLLQALRAYGQRYERGDAEIIRESLWQFLEPKGYGPKKKKGAKKKTKRVRS